jgi:hypothetical protein
MYNACAHLLIIKFLLKTAYFLYRVNRLLLHYLTKINFMKKQLLAILSLCAICYFGACKKDSNNAVQPTNQSNLNNMGDFVRQYGVDKQTISFNVTELPKTFTLSGGTRITISPNTLTVGGTPVTGNLSLEAYEVLKRSDVIFTGTNTNHISGLPLISDGFIFVDVKSNGSSVDQTLTGTFTVQIPTDREGQFTRIWKGDTDVNGTDQMGWAQPMNGGVDSIKAADSLFGFPSRDLGWINCDIFYGVNAPKTTITVSVPNNPGEMATFMGGSGNTYVLFCAQGENVVAQLYTPAGTNMVKSYDNTMPVGMTGRLIAFSIKDGKFYFAKQDVTITANMSASLTLAEASEGAVAAEIKALDSY